MKNKIQNFFRRLFLKNIMKKSNNYLPLTHRETAMVKFFLKFNTISLLILICWFYPVYVLIPEIKEIHNIPEPAALIITANAETTTTTPEIVKIPASTGVIREITMYTSRVEETDASPFITANGTDLREIDYNACASNAFPFGTELRIEGLGDCIVVDRMNKRYSNSVDWYAGMDLQRALNFGRQKLLVSEIK